MSILIIGGGLAGLFTALKLAPMPCTVLTPVPLGQGASSVWAQGGIAAAIGEGDTVEAHVADTLRAGAGLCDAEAVRRMAAEASARILDLLAFGVPFDRDLAGKLVQSREAAHSANRVVRVRGDMAGAKIMEALIAAVRRTPSIRVVEGAEAFELMTGKSGAITGARATLGDRIVAFEAHQVVLATGGAGQLFAITTNPLQATGAGLAMAHAAGATLANMEFVQFHPTALDLGRDPAPLATEALRGEGAALVDRDGQRFMAPLHADAELAPRDVVARGVFASIQAGRGAFLDCRTAIGAQFADMFPTVHASCRAAGLDPARDLLPVAPAAHYHMGGVLTDAEGRATGVPGLWAVGEVACTGVHGANRLASNSLLEAVVFGARAANALHRNAGETPRAVIMREAGPMHPEPPGQASHIAEIRALMQENCGVLRDEAGLQAAIARLRPLAEGGDRVARFARTALLMAEAADWREESRGGHSRTDFPEAWPDPVWTIQRRGDGIVPLRRGDAV